MELNQLWSQFRRMRRLSYRLYSRDIKPSDPAEDTRVRRFLHTLQQFAWAILEKLTPARRVLLLRRFFCLLLPAGGCHYRGENGEMMVGGIRFSLLWRSADVSRADARGRRPGGHET